MVVVVVDNYVDHVYVYVLVMKVKVVLVLVLHYLDVGLHIDMD